jgi:uncharacterized protein YdeI (YjbR/CyaY-like superfamily)
MELYVKNREEWREWLEKNHTTAQGIWLIYYKKPSGKQRIPYNDAVEEALCFGWIDSKIKRINDDYYIQWFTPRRPGSSWSELNIDRVQKMIKEGRMTRAGLAVYEEVSSKPVLIKEMNQKAETIVPNDLMNALKRNAVAFINFEKLPPSSRRLYVLWLNDAKRPETRRARIEKIVDRSEKNLRAGMM